MKIRSLIILILIFLVSGNLSAQENKAVDISELPLIPAELKPVKVQTNELEVGKNQEVVLEVHTVKEGDYLARIAEKYYGDKDKWKLIYSYNPYVKDSHWIFPGDSLVMPVVVDKLPELPALPEKAEVPRVYENFIAPEEFQFLGTIVDFKDENLLHAQGEYLFIDAGSDKNIEEKQKINVYRQGRDIYHPETGDLLGVMYEIIGEVSVTGDIEKESATAQIVYAHESLEVGDFLLKK
jgi:LysM repeat protein